MAMRDEPCKKCQVNDFYVKGNFSYCRPCHTEAQKRYLENKRMGVTPELRSPPNRSLQSLLLNSTDLKSYCANGHPYSGENLRVQAAVTGRLQRRCKACERNRKRVTYGLAPEPDPVRLTSLLDELG